jgi:type II secretory pathway pseudopilin PulG
MESLLTSRFYIRLAALGLAAILCVAAVQAWRADRRDRAQLAAELASTKQLLAAADARQHDRDTQLAQTLSVLDSEKRTIVTPAQIIRELPKSLPLPAPVTLPPDNASSVGARFSLPRGTKGASPATSPPQAVAGAALSSPAINSSDALTGKASPPGQASPAATDSLNPAPGGAFIPRADLKPLYDFTLDCQACQAKLAAAQNDLADERQKTAALTKERDDALRIAKGGNVWRRVGRAAKWFLIGAAAGAVISKAH